jgi:hypothetical protein
MRRIDLVMRGHGLVLLIDWKFSCLEPHQIAEREIKKMCDYVGFFMEQSPGCEVRLVNAIVYE